MPKYDTIGNIDLFLNKRYKKILYTNQSKIYRLQNINYFIKATYEYGIPNLYFARSGCRVKDSAYFCDEEYSKHDSIRTLGSLITFNLNEIIISLVVGNYNSAIIFLRNIIEWEVKILAAITDVSIYTKNNNDKNKVMCLEGIRELENTSNENHNNKILYNEKKKFINDLKVKDSNLVSQYPFNIFLFKMPSYNYIIKNLDPKLFEYLLINDNLNPKEYLLNKYKFLSEYIHYPISILDNLERGGAKEFYDQKEFNSIYNNLIEIYDVVLYFFIVLIELEILHGYKGNRLFYRKKIKKEFLKFLGNGKKELLSSKNLINSKIWNSKENIFDIEIIFNQ